MSSLGRVWVAVLGAALWPGCGSPSGTPAADAEPHAGDGDGGPPDAGMASAGLVLEFRGDPTLPAELGGEFDAVLDAVRVDLEEVRAIGDSAPGDERTTRAAVELDWYAAGEEEEEGEEETDANNDPVRVTFADAPPGLYSLVLAQVVRYRVRGTVVVDAETREFEIDDEPPSDLAISVDLDGLVLEPDAIREVELAVAVADAVAELRWDEVTPDGDGDLKVDENDGEHIAPVRDAVEQAFTLVNGPR
ncbi:MAG TPA: hypothetical protein VMZ28_25155 [Kofleriaceae bacterium]|nr:hypothetical protein [Kofleriaceae bacterium]